MLPQFGNTHFLDYLSTMDVVRIKEFGVLKFHGYIRTISASGKITPEGKPYRMVQLTVHGFSSLLIEGQLGLNMFLKAGTYLDLSADIKKFAGDIADIVKKEEPYSSMVQSIVNKWFDFINKNGGTKYANYLNEWIDFSTAMQGKLIPGIPKELSFFYTTEQSMTLWGILEKITQAPFNELWSDNGPRTVYVESNKELSGKHTEVNLDSEKEYLIIRATPFNGTIINKAPVNVWDNIKSRKIPINYITRFDLSKTMDESYSFYMVSPAVYNPGDLALIGMGRFIFDEAAFNKYLYRPLTHNLFYTQLTKKDSTEKSDDVNTVLDETLAKATTLKNWFETNDTYLNGGFTIQVPNDEAMDPRIGDKIEFEGLSDAFFYVEAISRTWTYGGSLEAQLSVTRGYGLSGPIELKDKIFKRGKFVMGAGYK